MRVSAADEDAVLFDHAESGSRLARARQGAFPAMRAEGIDERRAPTGNQFPFTRTSPGDKNQDDGEDLLRCNARASRQNIQGNPLTEEDFPNWAPDGGTVFDGFNSLTLFHMPFNTDEVSDGEMCLDS